MKEDPEFQSIYVVHLCAQVSLVQQSELESKLDTDLADLERSWVERDLLRLFTEVLGGL